MCVCSQLWRTQVRWTHKGVFVEVGKCNVSSALWKNHRIFIGKFMNHANWSLQSTCCWVECLQHSEEKYRWYCYLLLVQWRHGNWIQSDPQVAHVASSTICLTAEQHIHSLVAVSNILFCQQRKRFAEDTGKVIFTRFAMRGVNMFCYRDVIIDVFQPHTHFP